MNDVPTRLGRYQLRFRIAVGGMGGVFLARATGAGGADKVVAVKLLHEHLASEENVVSMFLDEARIASAIAHVNVATVFDFGEQDGLYFLVMEYLEGEALDRVLKSLLAGTERHPLHPWLIARLLADAAEGLHAAHESTGADGAPLEVVHRDVSPHNLFVTYDGVVKVVDFGIARARERSTATDAGTFKGKFEYASPEQIRARAVDRRADVWGLGVCLWELLTGTRLFQRADPSATGQAVLSEAIPAPSTVRPELPEGFDDVVMRALERDPSKRYQTAREFGRALRELLAGSGEVVDAPVVGEWLEALFPGDRAKRQALVAAVRRSGPDAPLESVPAELRVKGTGTGSSRNFRSESGSGQRATMREGSRSGARHKVVDREAELATTVKPPGAASSRLPALALAAVVVALVLGVGLLFWPRERTVVEAAGGAAPVAVVPTAIDPPSTGALPPAPSQGSGAQPGATAADPTPGAPEAPVEVALDAGVAVAEAAPLDAGVAVVEAAPLDAGLPTVADAGAQAAEVPPGGPVAAVKPPPPKPRGKEPSAPPARPKDAEPPPRPTVTAAPQGRGDGRVRFKTPGATAEVTVDGKVVGTTPMTIDLPAGQHTFELKARGFDFGGPQQLRVQVGGDYNIEIDMR